MNLWPKMDLGTNMDLWPKMTYDLTWTYDQILLMNYDLIPQIWLKTGTHKLHKICLWPNSDIKAVNDLWPIIDLWPKIFSWL